MHRRWRPLNGKVNKPYPNPHNPGRSGKTPIRHSPDLPEEKVDRSTLHHVRRDIPVSLMTGKATYPNILKLSHTSTSDAPRLPWSTGVATLSLATSRRHTDLTILEQVRFEDNS
ncbi:hypothetical protein AVEN_148198-1 [Araneus ventricosus]|uniref:Uncharacterized protein n=1 Tax=Araneus ventricosus TaxID=182803 RepID=A0A4Y2DC64_ARAVE|nr:hypothetical protein AVEN_148198-1 [Araneus ventricosus]